MAVVDLAISKPGTQSAPMDTIHESGFERAVHNGTGEIIPAVSS